MGSKKSTSQKAQRIFTAFVNVRLNLPTTWEKFVKDYWEQKSFPLYIQTEKKGKAIPAKVFPLAMRPDKNHQSWEFMGLIQITYSSVQKNIEKQLLDLQHNFYLERHFEASGGECDGLCNIIQPTQLADLRGELEAFNTYLSQLVARGELDVRRLKASQQNLACLDALHFDQCDSPFLKEVKYWRLISFEQPSQTRTMRTSSEPTDMPQAAPQAKSAVTPSEPTPSGNAFFERGNYYSFEDANQVVVFLRVIHRTHLTWGGLFCPRFSDLEQCLGSLSVPYAMETRIANEKEIAAHYQQLKVALDEFCSTHSDLNDLGIQFKLLLWHEYEYKLDGETITFSDGATSTLSAIPDVTMRSHLMNCQNYHFYNPSSSTVCYYTYTEAFHDEGDGLFSSILLQLNQGSNSTIIANPKKRNLKILGFSLKIGDKDKAIFTQVNEEDPYRFQTDAPIALDTLLTLSDSGWYLKVNLADCPDKDCPRYSINDPIKVLHCNKIDASSSTLANQYILFIDVGSTRVKFVEAQVEKNKISVTPKHLLKSKKVMMTNTFLEEYKLKKILTEENISIEQLKHALITDKALFETFFISLTREYSARLQKEGRLLHSVYCCFPTVNRERDESFLKKRSEVIDCEIGPFVCASKERRFILIAEHLALRNMFKPLLTKLIGPVVEEVSKKCATLRAEAEAQLDDAKRADQRSFLGKVGECAVEFLEKKSWKWNTDEVKQKKQLFKDVKERTDAISDSDAYEFIDELNKVGSALEKFKNTLLLDGGGYSLDAYCVDSKGERFLPLTGSFKCGGEALVNRYYEELKKTRDVKIGIVRTNIFNDNLTNLALFKEKLNEVYHEPIDCIKDDAFPLGYKKGCKNSILILSGQVFKNQHLADLFKEANNFGVVLSTQRLYEALAFFFEENGGAPIGWKPSKDLCKQWNIFKAIALTQGESKQYPSTDYDLVGGMLQNAINNLN